jgi:hypothetical protein
MPNSDPAWITAVEVTVIVNNEPVVPEPSLEVAAGDVDRYSGNSTSYQTVAEWTVTTDKVGKLHEVSLVSNNYAKTLFKLEIASITFMQDITIKTALTLPFNGLSIAEGETVTLSAKSSDGTSITVDGAITGTEIG